MDIAYDHIQEENFKESEGAEKQAAETQSNLNQEFQDAYKAISSSPWGTKLGGWFATAKKQGQSYLEEAKREYNTASTEASKNLTSLVTRARSLSLNQDASASTNIASADGQTFTEELPRASTDTNATATAPTVVVERPDSLPADIVKEAESMLTRFRGEAAKRLKDIQKAEDAADEALLKFGTNIRSFLRDAVTVTAPPEDEQGKDGGKVLFESKDAEGKRVIHTTRFDAQLHVIHSSLDSFLRDPKSELYEPWAKDFDIDKKTEEIAKDLDKYEELRRAMEKCVPEKVDYGTFWTRYYFLRHVIETEEARRRELLKGAATTEEEVAWDEDSDSEGSATPNNAGAPSSSTTTLTKNAAPTAESKAETDTLKPTESRRSHDQQSQAGSDASYDIVSGASSRAPGSPTDSAKGKDKVKRVAEESDEEDWE
ncbi:BSD domain-containing protein [Rhizodiscina lignyota]|uniref:BSD domain-containing protein n=1 Tax=Rhizodiscina lignyota TaxID=1504668 RepID=A0A9P4ICL7_9PEZI|nr:BSD domain-containing protein [Rhizodiscina lignyota]